MVHTPLHHFLAQLKCPCVVVRFAPSASFQKMVCSYLFVVTCASSLEICVLHSIFIFICSFGDHLFKKINAYKIIIKIKSGKWGKLWYRFDIFLLCTALNWWWHICRDSERHQTCMLSCYELFWFLWRNSQWCWVWRWWPIFQVCALDKCKRNFRSFFVPIIQSLLRNEERAKMTVLRTCNQ